MYTCTLYKYFHWCLISLSSLFFFFPFYLIFTSFLASSTPVSICISNQDVFVRLFNPSTHTSGYHLYILLGKYAHTYTPMRKFWESIISEEKTWLYKYTLSFFFFYYQILQKNERLLKVTAVMLLCFLFLPWCVYHDLVFSFLTLNNAMVDLG